MTRALEPKSDVENNFQSMVTNEIEIEQIENSVQLNEKLTQICLRMAEVNVIYQSLTGLVTETNEISRLFWFLLKDQ